ncbi:hypothetical protein vseg_017319 [Gypsophila vaccaria]
MAINTNGRDSSACSSPRISFSNDLTEIDSPETQREVVDVIRLDSSLLSDSNTDFDFCVTSLEDKETYCPADELFFNGMIIPTLMKQKLNSINRLTKDEDEEEEEDDEITASTTATLIREEKTQSKSIWRFTRSSSLNYDNDGLKKSSIWSLPLLFRNKSTGSSLANSSSGNSNKHRQKTTNKLSSNQKPPLKKSGSSNGGGGGGSGGFTRSYLANNNNNNSNGGRNGRVLNVPSPYIAKGTSDLLGFSSLFRNGSVDKKGKR